MKSSRKILTCGEVLFHRSVASVSVQASKASPQIAAFGHDTPTSRAPGPDTLP